MARFREASLGAKIAEHLGFRGCRCRESSGWFAIASKICGMCLRSQIKRIRIFLFSSDRRKPGEKRTQIARVRSKNIFFMTKNVHLN